MKSSQYPLTNKYQKRAVCIFFTGIALIASSATKAESEGRTQPCVYVDPAEDVQTVTDANAIRWVEFQSFVHDWRTQRGAMSSITAMCMLRPYQKIIGMGLHAIPLILAEIRAEGDDPDQWFWALTTITEANSLTPPEIDRAIRGDYQAMAQVWLEWGNNIYYAG